MILIKLFRHVRCVCAFATLLLITLPSSATRYACDSGSSADQSTIEIHFRHFFKQPVGPSGLEFTDSIREANGKSVCLTGYMVKQETSVAGRFILAPLPIEMHEHSDGEADDLPASAIIVYLDESQKDLAIPHEAGLLAVRGILAVGRHEDEDGRVSWVQLKLFPDQIKLHGDK